MEKKKTQLLFSQESAGISSGTSITTKALPNLWNCNQTNSMNEGKSGGNREADPVWKKISQRGPNCAFHLNAERWPQSPLPERHLHVPTSVKQTAPGLDQTASAWTSFVRRYSSRLPVPAPPHSTQYPHQPAGSRGNSASVSPEVNQRQRLTCSPPGRCTPRQGFKEHAPISDAILFQGTMKPKGQYFRCGQKSLKAVPVSLHGAILLKTKLGIKGQWFKLTVLLAAIHLEQGTQENGEFMKFQKEILGYKQYSFLNKAKGNFRKTSTSASLITPKPLTVWITTNWKIVKEMGNTRPPYLSPEKPVFRSRSNRTKQGTTDWFTIGKAVHEGCILLPCLFNLYAEYVMLNARLNEAQATVKIAR